MKGWIPAAIVIVFAGSAAAVSSTAQPTAEGASIVGAWTLNKDASDPPPGRAEGERGRRSGGGGSGFGVAAVMDAVPAAAVAPAEAGSAIATRKRSSAGSRRCAICSRRPTT